MPRFYAVNSGRVPGVYQTWAEASAETNGFPGAVHSSFRDLNAAVQFSGIPLQQQPQWVRTTLGVPDPAQAHPTPAAGPPPSHTPIPPSALPPSAPHASIVSSRSLPTGPQPNIRSIASNSVRERHQDTSASLIEALRGISIHTPAAPARAIGPGSVASSPVSLTRRSETSDNLFNREAGDQHAPALIDVLTRATAASVSIASGVGDPRHSTPIRSPHTSPIPSPSHALHPIGIHLSLNLRSSPNHSGWVEDSILSGVFHPPASNVNSFSGDPSNDASSSSSTCSDEVWLDPMEPMPGGLYEAEDSLPHSYRIALRTSPRDSTHYAPVLTTLLGQHAVNYMFLHYYSAGSTVVVANAYARHEDNPRGFVEHMAGVGMPPRQAAYLWTIISPETTDHPQSQFSYFRWAAAMRDLARGGGSALRGESAVGPDSDSVTSRESDLGPNDVDPDAAAASLTGVADVRTDSGEASGERTDHGTRVPVPGEGEGEGSDSMDIDDELEYVDYPEEDANQEDANQES